MSEAEVADLRDAVDAEPDDAVALVADDPDIADAAIEAVADRARAAIAGVPEETRDANPDGTSSYLRPLPGSARMYPETDVPPVDPDPGAIETPELLTEKVDRYVDELGLDAGLAEQVAYGQRWAVFEDAVDRGVDPALAARTVESTVTELSRDDVPVERLDGEHFLAVLEMVAEDELASEGVPDLLESLAENPDADARDLAEAAGLGSADEGTVREAVRRVIERNAEQVADEGMGAFSGLMGECMGELRGKADGDLVSDVLREEIQQRAE